MTHRWILRPIHPYVSTTAPTDTIVTLNLDDLNMSPLQFPKNATSMLGRAYRGEANNSESDKWLIYLASSEVSYQDAQELFHDAMESYNDQCLGAPESEWEELGFLKSTGTTDAPLQDLQHILEHHLRLIERQLSKSTSQNPDQFYKFGFIAVTRPDWREHGVTAVHCDKDRGKWKVTQCSGIAVDQLGLELSSVSDLDITFDEVRGRYDQDSDNSGQDNEGGPAPVGLWQCAVFCIEVSQNAAEDAIPDPRGDPSWRMGEGCLWFLSPEAASLEQVKEKWPVAYANGVKNPTIPAIPGERRITVWHPSLFVFYEGGGESVKIMRMDWDHGIERSEDQLRRVGRESQTTMHLCEPAFVVATLEKLANESTSSM